MHKAMMVVMGASVLLGCAGRGEAPASGMAPVEAAASGTAPVEAPGVEAAGPGAEGRAERHGMKAPFVLAIEGPGEVQAGAVADLTVRVNRRFVDETPLLISLKVPEGVVLLEGLESEEIVDPTAGEIVRTYQVRVDDPSAVLVVQATMGGEGFGAVATREYHFRTKPLPARVLPKPGAQVRPAR